MFTAYTQGLHYQGYALSLLLLELALVMNVMSQRAHASPGALAGLLLLGFLQGWMSWDYCFLVTFAPLPVALLATPVGSPIPWRNVLAQCVAVGSGFTAAVALHFTQSALYFGDLRTAIEEYTFRSNKLYGVADVLEGTTL